MTDVNSISQNTLRQKEGGCKTKLSLPFDLSKQSNPSGSYPGSSKTSVFWRTASLGESKSASSRAGPITSEVGGTPVQQGIGGGGVPGSHLGCAGWLFSEKNWHFFKRKIAVTLNVADLPDRGDRGKESWLGRIQVNLVWTQRWCICVLPPSFLSLPLSPFQIVSPTSNSAAGGKLQLSTLTTDQLVVRVLA